MSVNPSEGQIIGNNGRQGVYIEDEDAWREANQAVRDAGLDPTTVQGRGAVEQAYETARTYNAAASAPTTSRSGSSAAANAIKTLYSRWQQPSNPGLMSLLSQFAEQARGTNRQAVDSLTGSINRLAGESDQMWSRPIAQAQLAENPLAQYMQASGVAPTQVDALRGVLQAQNQGTTDAFTAMRDMIANSNREAWRSRQADVSTMGAAADQSLSRNLAMLQQAQAMRDQQSKDELMMQILQMAINSGVDISRLGVRF